MTKCAYNKNGRCLRLSASDCLVDTGGRCDIYDLVTVEFNRFHSDHWVMYTYRENADGSIDKGLVELEVSSKLDIDAKLLERLLNEHGRLYQ